MLFSCPTSCFALQMESAFSSEISVDFKELHCLMSQKIELLNCWYSSEDIQTLKNAAIREKIRRNYMKRR
jgi:hypothetical protein